MLSSPDPPIAPPNPQVEQAKRLRKFIVTNIPLSIAFAPFLVFLHLKFNIPVLLVISLELTSNMIVQLWAYKQTQKGNIENAVFAICIQLWIIIITVAYIVPFIGAIIVTLNMLVVVLALPYVTPKTMRKIMFLSICIVIWTGTLAFREDTFGLAHLIPAAYRQTSIIISIPLITGIIYLLLGQYNNRLGETLNKMKEANQALLESERTLEKKVVQRTRELKASEQRYRFILQASPDPVILYNIDGTANFVNAAFERTFGWSQDEILGKAIDFIPQENEGEIHSLMVKAFNANGHVQGYETKRLTKAGKMRDVQLSMAVLEDKDGKFVGNITILRDITERKLAETELKVAKEDAVAATRAKSAFLASMSHEIRTPMNAIIGMTGLLLDTQLSTDQRDFTEIIREGSDTLLSLINDILDFSKIEAGRLEFEMQPINLRACIESAIDLVAIQAGQKQLDLAYLIDSAVPEGILGDITRIRQILVNLLNNAIKFTKQGEVVLNVEVVDKDDKALISNTILHFSVRDTGIGIPPSSLGDIFKSFSQVDASTTRKYGGTGLGLAICKRLVELMNGTMWAESEGVTGKGSTFHFQIPVTPTELPEGKLLAKHHVHLNDKTVLIVDDNATNRKILTLQAKSWNMKPDAVDSPLVALERIKQGESFDLAILDVHMPEMDGMTLAKKIRQYRDTSTLPIVILTSIGRTEIKADQAYYNAYVNKPLKTSQLYDTLIQVFLEHSNTTIEKKSQQLIHTMPQKQRSLRILLAEDNLVNQKVAIRILERLGYRADIVANGLEVIDSLKRQTYDVVFMDIQMPEMDGFEATQVILDTWSTEQRPYIIAMTANAMKGDREKCLKAGMDDYVSKPIRPPMLQKALENVPQHILTKALSPTFQT